VTHSPTTLAENERLAGYLLAGLMALDTVVIGIEGGDTVVVILGLAVSAGLIASLRFGNRVVGAFVSVLAAFSPVFVGLAALSLVFGGFLMVRTMQAVSRANAEKTPEPGSRVVAAHHDDDEGLPPGVDQPLRVDRPRRKRR
jgi:hypothetical protein